MADVANKRLKPIDRLYNVTLLQQSVCFRLAENLVFHARTKDVEVHYHFLREKVLQEEIKMC